MNRLFAFVLLPLLTATMPVHAQQPDNRPPRVVSVSGEGTVRAEPDQATVRFGIVSQAMEPETAREKNATAAKNAMNAVRELGVPENKIRLEHLSLQPRREYDPETRTYEDLGYEAVRQVVVELEDLDMLPTLVARVVQEGANRLDGIEYELSDREAVRNEALRSAATDARAKAELLAQTLGTQLGPVHQINEQSFDFPRPVYRAAFDMAKAESAQAQPEPDAYAAGEIEVRATVQVVFELATP